ncbi:hypothetical protein DLM78_05735 [Leptospira stimsonii]|uniref:Uncharacterized protein n=1 Tax=Leptospira stimsonii TaxID=2202203 RepID=A0A8B3CYK1_9LEPT|nr:hypothetical protein DLM78_05735 [Leptospira stimsonii]
MFLDNGQRSFKYPNIPILTKSLLKIAKSGKEHSQIFHVSEIFDSYFYLIFIFTGKIEFSMEQLLRRTILCRDLEPSTSTGEAEHFGFKVIHQD